jgi:penicillin-binding protein 1A
MTIPARRYVVVMVVAHALALGGGVLAGLSLSRDLPGIDRLDVMDLPQRTVLLDRANEPLYTFAEQKRIPITIDQASPWYLKAIVATEDPRFREHIGVDPIAVARAALKTIRTMDFGVEGASTITMQLARLQFLHPKKTISRKIQEAVLATQIERNYSKEEILSFYFNRIYLGHGTYGIEAASRHYFGKPARGLTLDEAALLAGLTQIPERLTPFRHPERALRRRNHVLQRMTDEGMIAEEVAREAMKAELVLADTPERQQTGLYFVEEVRRWIAREFGENALYREGLVVETTLDVRLQRIAERAVLWGLDEYGRRHRQLPEAIALPDDSDPQSFHHPVWELSLAPRDVVPAIVVSVGEETAAVRIRDAILDLDAAAFEWTGRRARQLLREGTITRVRVERVDALGAPSRISLASAPKPEAALIALDAASGEVLALVGGKDFEASEFDRAMQAQRQAGSAFKPFIYAAALELGFLPTDSILDEPVVLVDRGLDAPYQPENFERDYEGLVTLRHALEHSRNIPTVKLLDAIGYTPAVDIARRLGISSTLQPYPSLALGSFEVRLSNLVAAYAAFVNGGVLVRPSLLREVRHAARQELWQSSDEAEEVLSPEVAAMMASLLEGVVLHGTGRQALALGRPVAGKTGTTDDYTDAWFVGFTPSIAVGVWVGNDRNESLGKRETGARAALPIWVSFLEEALRDQPVEEFIQPPGVRRTLVDSESGLAARPESGCRGVVLETLPEGRESRPPCSWVAHARRKLPQRLQAFEMDSAANLKIPPADLARLVSWAPERLKLLGGGRVLAYDWGDSVGRVNLAWGEHEWLQFIDALPLAAEGRRTSERGRIEFEESWIEAREQSAALTGREEEPEDGPTLEEAMPPDLRLGLDGLPARVLPVNRSGEVRWSEIIEPLSAN